jgi:hypothetical protein
MKELLEVSREILKWIKTANYERVKPILETTLFDDSRKLVYHLSDGNNTSSIIASKTPVSTYSISIWWRQWANLGIVEFIPVKGGGSRGKKIFDLEDFDITIPKIPEKKPEE